MENLSKKTIIEAYSQVARNNGGCSCGSCGNDLNDTTGSSLYTNSQILEGGIDAYLGLSCGNPTAIASLRPGETVLDLGSGGGFDCFLAAVQVGNSGKVIGVDMTPDMISRARHIAETRKIQNVEFKLAEIENLPVSDYSIDVIMSNCVINLSSDKSRVFKEAFRVLKPGGRIAISDVVLLKELPSIFKENIKKFNDLFCGAILIEKYKRIIEDAGFKNINIKVKESFCMDEKTNDPLGQAMIKGLGGSEFIKDYVSSVYVEGNK